MPPPPELSIVIPCLDEAETLEPLLSRLGSVLAAMAPIDAEIVFVDDGSTDATASMLEAAASRDPRVKLLVLSRNFGQQAALSAGLEAATGRAVVLMDADLQDPPELIPDLVARWREGFQVVYAVRRSRRESAPKRAAYAAFYRVFRSIASIDVPLDAGDFSLLDAEVAGVLRSMPERNRFLRGLRSWVGYRQIAVEYDRPARAAGTPKYGLRRLLRLAVDGWLGFSAIPLRIASGLGIAAALLGFLLVAWVFYTKLAGIPSPRGWASTAALILFVGGVQLLVLGVIGEYLGRIYDEVRRRPAFVVRRRVGFEAAAAPAVRRA